MSIQPKWWRVVLILAAMPACHGKDASTTPSASAPSSFSAQADASLCNVDGKRVVTYDLNHDGKPDVWLLYQVMVEGGTKIEVLTCKQVDFDHDGRKDWIVAYDRGGHRVYERADLDYDGKWDMVAVYDPKTGTLTHVERNTGFDGRFDVEEIYDGAGKLTTVRRDRNGDGQPNLWEQYRDGVLEAILYDDDFDGKVDRREDVPGTQPKVEMPTALDRSTQPLAPSGRETSPRNGASP